MAEARATAPKAGRQARDGCVVRAIAGPVVRLGVATACGTRGSIVAIRASTFLVKSGEEADGAGEAALVQELAEIAGGGVVAVAAACFQLPGHGLEKLLPGR